VRELENVVRKAVLLAQSYTINPDHVRAVVTKANELASTSTHGLEGYVEGMLTAARQGEVADAHARVLEAVERQLFARAIKQANGNQAKAARWLGVSRVTMKAKLVQFGLHPAQERD
jgi:DNA-binding NtrC family response regulator